MSQDAVQEIELNIEQAKAFIQRADALNRLCSNPDFQDVVLKGYFEQEAVRLVHVKGDPNTQAYETQRDILRDIDGIGCLKSYFTTIQRQCEWAQSAIDESHELLAELREEGADA